MAMLKTIEGLAIIALLILIGWLFDGLLEGM